MDGQVLVSAADWPSAAVTGHPAKLEVGDSDAEMNSNSQVLLLSRDGVFENIQIYIIGIIGPIYLTLWLLRASNTVKTNDDLLTVKRI